MRKAAQQPSCHNSSATLHDAQELTCCRAVLTYQQIQTLTDMASVQTAVSLVWVQPQTSDLRPQTCRQQACMSQWREALHTWKASQRIYHCNLQLNDGGDFTQHKAKPGSCTSGNSMLDCFLPLQQPRQLKVHLRDASSAGCAAALHASAAPLWCVR